MFPQQIGSPALTGVVGYDVDAFLNTNVMPMAYNMPVAGVGVKSPYVLQQDTFSSKAKATLKNPTTWKTVLASVAAIALAYCGVKKCSKGVTGAKESISKAWTSVKTGVSNKISGIKTAIANLTKSAKA